MTPRYQAIRQQVEHLAPEEQLNLLQDLANLLFKRSTFPVVTDSEFPLSGTVLRYDDPFGAAVDPINSKPRDRNKSLDRR
jgi:hypothetical protein